MNFLWLMHFMLALCVHRIFKAILRLNDNRHSLSLSDYLKLIWNWANFLCHTFYFLFMWQLSWCVPFFLLWTFLILKQLKHLATSVSTNISIAFMKSKYHEQFSLKFPYLTFNSIYTSRYMCYNRLIMLPLFWLCSQW